MEIKLTYIKKDGKWVLENPPKTEWLPILKLMAEMQLPIED